MVYLKGDGPHQMVMIVCECSWFTYIIIFIWWKNLCSLTKFSQTTRNSLLLL